MKRKLLFILVSVLVLSQDCLSQSAICSYGYRKRITFDPTRVAGPADLTDFPVLINVASDNDLRTTGNSGHVSSTNGYDIVFTAADGVTVLNHELTAYTATSGAMQCWVKIPNLSTSINTYIYMYYGNSSATVNPSSSGTWSNGYVGVWHFDNSLNNSTSTTGLNGTNNGSTNTGTAMFNSARSFSSGSSQYIDVTPYNAAYDLTANVCVSAWIRLTSNGADQKILGNQDNANGGWKFGVFSDNKIEFEIRTSGNSPFLSRSASGGTALGTGTWYYVVGQYSNAGDFIDTYLNGSLDRNYSTTASLGASGGTMKFGREPFGGAYLNGIEDEVRLSSVARSADWITTEYNNQNSPSTFYSISAEPNVFLGGTNANWNTNGNWSSGSTPSASTDVILSPTGNQPNLNADIQLASLWIRPSTTLTIGNNRTLSILHDITNCGVIVGNNASSEVLMNSTSAYSQTQYLSGSGTYNLRDLTINNTFSLSPSVVMNSPVDITNDLTLTSGVVSTTTTNILSLGTGATSTGGSASSYVSGPMSKAGSTAFIFPVGKGGRWRRLGISAPSSSSTFRAEYLNTAYTNTSTVNSPLTDVSKIEYWQLDRTVGTGNASVSLYWESAGGSGIDNCADLTIARFNGTGWDERVATTGGSSTCTGTGAGLITTTAVVTAFSPFTFGSKSTTLNPLPIELIDFKVRCDKNTAILEWETASERNNDYFNLERSLDGEVWTSVAKIKSAGNSSTSRNYSYSDDFKTSSPAYYRLVQVDLDGSKSVFRNVISSCITMGNHLRLFPNPAMDAVNLDFNLEIATTGTLKIIDNIGRLLFTENLRLGRGSSIVGQSLNLKPGSYTVLFQTEQFTLKDKLLIVK